MTVSHREKEKKQKRKRNVKEWAKDQDTKTRAHLKLPDGISEWRPSPGVHDVDFMLFIAEDYNPQADKGEDHYERTYFVHRLPGPDGKMQPYCCLYKNWGKVCPICKVMNDSSTNRELAKSMWTQKRHLWLINDKPGDPKNALQVFDTNHQNQGKGFGELMIDLLNSLDDDVDPFDLEEGMTFRVNVKELAWEKGKYNAVTRLDLVKRKKQYSPDLLESAPCLDDFLVEMSDEEILKLLAYGEVDTSETNGEVPKASDKSKPKAKEEDEEVDPEDPEDEDLPPDKTIGKGKGKNTEKTATECGIKVGSIITHPKLGECAVKKISPDGTSLTVQDEDGDLESGVAPEDCKLVPVKGKTPNKPAKPAKGKGKPDPDEDEDDEDSDDDSDDEDEDDFEEDEEEEPEPVKKAGRKVGGKAQGNKGGK